MKIKLKPLHQQVMVITGATSSIGLATLHIAVEQGMKVFMIARNEDELQKIQDEMRSKGYDTAYAVADVAEEMQLQSAADQCIKTFGKIDTWVNNAGISINAKLTEMNSEDARRMFDTNFWGVVNGCNTAIPFLRENGGALINIGSVPSHVALPIQGLYSASKHAVKGYTDALRRELLTEKAPISITLITPGAIDTAYTEHAHSEIGRPIHTPPVYSADVAARAILKCATKPMRELGVGSSTYVFPFLDKLFPRITDSILSKKYMEKDQSQGGGDKEGNLYESPITERNSSGCYPGHVMKSSLATNLAFRAGWIKSLAASSMAMFVYKKLRKI